MFPLSISSLEINVKSKKLLGPINLLINQKGITIVIGANGSGKTTLLGMLAAMDAPDSGSVEIADDNLTHKPKAETGELCICLAATQAPLVFNSWLPKLLQPFIRI